ncbi:hypothetical protein Ptc2401_01332 [Prosthecochloris sp. CIB 2401]|nr:hypothetical protein Ptc2401_01332 [Prosthecochloris sp. CIB 2401]
MEPGEVAGAVAQEREGFFADGGEDEFTELAVGEDFAGIGVDDFGDEVVFEDVHALLGWAFHGDTGADDFAEPVDVEGFDAEEFLDFLAHFFCPGFGAEDAGFELDLAGVDLFVADGFAEEGGVGGGAGDDGGAEVLHELELFLGVAAGDGDDGCSEVFGAVVEAEAAGEEPVAVSDLDDVAAGDAGHGE